MDEMQAKLKKMRDTPQGAAWEICETLDQIAARRNESYEIQANFNENVSQLQDRHKSLADEVEKLSQNGIALTRQQSEWEQKLQHHRKLVEENLKQLSST